MKKLWILLVLAYVATASLFCQAIQYDIKLKYTHSAAPVTADIIVNVKEGHPNFTYYLMTNDPVNGQILAQSGSHAGKSYVFKDVKPGKYFVKIVDKEGLPAGKTIEIKESANGQN
jgi:hypothetical protein